MSYTLWTDSNYFTHLQNTHNKKIEAIETLWDTVLEVKKGIPSSIGLCLSVFPDTEFNNSSLDRPTFTGESIGQLISKLDYAKDPEFIVRPAARIDRLRPFLNEDLYSLFKAYVAIIGRTTHLFIYEYQNGTLKPWKKDTLIQSHLESVLDDREHKYIMEQNVASFSILTNLLELKMLNIIRNSLSGTDHNINTISHIKKFKEIWELENK